MAKSNESSSSGSFQGFNIGTLENDLGMILPGVGESPGEKKEEKNGSEEDQKTKTNLDLSFFSQKMSIPETPEEIQAAKGEKKRSGW